MQDITKQKNKSQKINFQSFSVEEKQKVADILCLVFEFINSTENQIESWNKVFKFMILSLFKVSLILLFFYVLSKIFGL